jgi:hypothetical protein
VSRPEKLCATCGRRITWRKKWARDWDQVRHCSQRCRKKRLGVLDQEIEKVARARLQAQPWLEEAWLAERFPGAGRERLRDALRRLVARGEARLPRGQDASTTKGPLRLRSV